MRTTAVELALVYPHQLFERHPALARGRGVLLLEDPLFFGTDRRWPLRVHKSRLVLHRASMRAWLFARLAEGVDVKLVDLPRAEAVDSTSLLESVVEKRIRVLHVADPVDDVLGRRLRRFAEARGIRLEVHPTPNFLSPPDFLEREIGRKKRPFMAAFYQAQRTRMRLLLEPDGTPTGGRWSFDSDNRKRFPAGHLAPSAPRTPHDADTIDAIRWVEARFPDNPGDAATFAYPVSHDAAEAWLEQFLEERFADFGAYEDAISREHRVLFHGVLTPMLNVGLLDPSHVVARAVEHARAHRVPLNSLEGFVRQIVGWREFVRGVYVHRGVEMRRGNFWGFERRMPRSFYEAHTGIPPVDEAIRRVLDHGWCHHIERLMVLGAFMLLCRIRPDDVYTWFMELFVDAYDWVMVPNVYGMSQFADGGIFATKPYLCGSNYILKMSDHAKGPWCEVWDALFWSFIGDHLGYFSGNHRLSMMAATWRKMPAAKQVAHRRRATEFLARLDAGNAT
ncbi:cryptochrome/photolyase family protein [Congregicoccus parvus]|uniref:cryptochrome/photolyase family protein n=1 Tax=Congregicoccus parvus TaxID=3081749 RepID=UPI003FA5A90B